jgi:methionyl-tRNA formyltransferase
MRPLRTLFFGTAPLARPSLEALVHSPNHQILTVVTQPDRPAGRKLRLQPSPVKSLALQLGLPLHQPERARNPSFIESVRALRPDIAIIVAYGQILPQNLLDSAPLGFLNVHASLLPQYRGAAPIQWALLNGDPKTGVTIMKLDHGLDTGPILSQRTTPIHDSDNALSLHDRLAQLGAQLLIETLPPYTAGQLSPQKQPLANASYARKISRDDARIDWYRPALQLWNQSRALLPWPGTFTHLPHQPNPLLLKIWETEPVPTPPSNPGRILNLSPAGILIACGQNALRLRVVQPEGRRRMSAAEFLAGHPLQPGQSLLPTEPNPPPAAPANSCPDS